MGKIICLSALAVLLFACKKDVKYVPDNDAPYYGDVPTVLVRNYINRLYIDLIGREPLDTEMEAEVLFLRAGGLSEDTRRIVVEKLQNDTSFILGDTSFYVAYYQRFYDMSKVRFLEGVSDGEIAQQYGIYYQNYIADSISGNTVGMAENQDQMLKLDRIRDSKFDYRNGVIEVTEVAARMLNNYFYDFINMNTFNFVNATFNDLYFRYPTTYEMSTAYDVIEFNSSATLFGQTASNKEEYISVMVSTREFYEGMIIWAFKSLLARDPTTYETFTAMQTFYTDHDFQEVQEDILVTDEYANF